MKNISLTLVGCLLILASCTTESGGNLLVRIQRSEELADGLASLIIHKEPIVEEPGMRDYIQREIIRAKQQLAEAHDARRGGMFGFFTPVKSGMGGSVLYKDGRLMFSTDFYSTPGPDLHLYLTTVVDPRDVAMPDVTAVDLGRLEYPYGALTLPVARLDDPERFRTVALWDVKLKLLYGFAQLSKQK